MNESSSKALLKQITLAIVLALILSAVSVIIAWNLFISGAGDSFVPRIILWNFQLAEFVVASGMVPICKQCEMMTLIQFGFYAFILGLIGYFLILFTSLRVIDRKKQRPENWEIKTL